MISGAACLTRNPRECISLTHSWQFRAEPRLATDSRRMSFSMVEVVVVSVWVILDTVDLTGLYIHYTASYHNMIGTRQYTVKNVL